MDVLVDVKWGKNGNPKGSFEIVIGDLAVSACSAESIDCAASEVTPTPEPKTCAGLSATCEGERDLPLRAAVGESRGSDEGCEY